jgi:hypothetical protein
MNNYNWLTSDKNKKISSSKTPVHLVLPDDEVITCNAYDGDGIFDGYDLFGIVSFGKLFVFSDELFLYISEKVDSESVCEIKKYIPSHAQLEVFSTDLEIIEINGKEKSIKNFIKDKTLVSKELKEYLPYKYPLKFASRLNASYNELAPSKFCGK